MNNPTRLPDPDRLLTRARHRCAILDGLIRTLDADVLRGHPADGGLGRFFQAHRECGSRDRRFLSEAVFAWFRWRGVLTPALPPNAPAALMALVLDGQSEECADLFPLEFPGLDLQAAPPPTALSERLAAFFAWSGLPACGPERLVPDWVTGQIYLPPDESAEDFQRRIRAEFQARPPLWIRFRPTPAGAAFTRFQASCPGAEAHPHRPDALRLPARFNLRGHPDWEKHLIVQDLASQAVAAVCRPQPGETWWDACSGAGGKALHLADLMGSSGTILATDIRPAILEENRRRARKAGVHTIRCQLWKIPQDPAPTRRFDGVLLDVPCSGLGTWARNPDARWRMDPDRIRKLAEEQLQLLEAAAPKVRPEGVLIYATCTLTTVENGEPLKRFLDAHPEFQPDPFPHPFTGAECPSGRLWIYPWDGPGCNGMFIARFRRGAE